MFCGQTGMSVQNDSFMLNFTPNCFTIATLTMFGLYYAEIDKPKEPITRGQSRAARGVVIAPEIAEQKSQRPHREVQGRGKMKLVEH